MDGLWHCFTNITMISEAIDFFFHMPTYLNILPKPKAFGRYLINGIFRILTWRYLTVPDIFGSQLWGSLKFRPYEQNPEILEYF